MSSPVHLQYHFDAGRRHLVCLRNQVFLAENSAEFRRVRGQAARAIVLDLTDLWREFEALAGDRIEFTKRDLAKAGGISTRMIWRWQDAGYLPSHAGPYDAVECFTAGLVGSLIRAGATATAISKASRLMLCAQSTGVRR